MSNRRVVIEENKRNNFLIRWFINTIAIVLTATLMSGIQVSGLVAVVTAGFILGIVNAVIRPFLVVLSLPLTILTLGLFTFVINGLMLRLTAAVIPGFVVSGFWTAFFGAVLISFFSYIISVIFE